VTANELRSIIHYDPNTGEFSWINTNKPGRHARPGWTADKGYLRIEIDGKAYRAHRLAWLYMYGENPDQIDHINGVKLDNRICNLRNVTRQVNAQNQRAASRNNKVGLLGVTKMCQRYRAQVRDPINKKIFYLGTFDTPEEAHRAYIEKKRELHPGCTI